MVFFFLSIRVGRKNAAIVNWLVVNSYFPLSIHTWDWICQTWEFPISYGDWICQNGRHWNGGSIGMLFQLHPSALKQKDAKRICPSLLQPRLFVFFEDRVWTLPGGALGLRRSLGEGAFLAHLIRDAVQISYGFEEASTVSIDLGSESYLLNYRDHMGIIVTKLQWLKRVGLNWILNHYRTLDGGRPASVSSPWAPESGVAASEDVSPSHRKRSGRKSKTNNLSKEV